jgi:hypothetical protein
VPETLRETQPNFAPSLALIGLVLVPSRVLSSRVVRCHTGGNEEEFTDVMNIESLDLVRCRKVTERALGYANC